MVYYIIGISGNLMWWLMIRAPIRPTSWEMGKSDLVIEEDSTQQQQGSSDRRLLVAIAIAIHPSRVATPHPHARI
jgi:hypothetical protein